MKDNDLDSAIWREHENIDDQELYPEHKPDRFLRVKVSCIRRHLYFS